MVLHNVTLNMQKSFTYLMTKLLISILLLVPVINRVVNHKKQFLRVQQFA